MSPYRKLTMHDYTNVPGMRRLIDPWLRKQELTPMLITSIQETDDERKITIVYCASGPDGKLERDGDTIVEKRITIDITKPFPWDKATALRRLHQGEEIRSGLKDPVNVILNGGNVFA